MGHVCGVVCFVRILLSAGVRSRSRAGGSSFGHPPQVLGPTRLSDAMPAKLGPFEAGQILALPREGYSHRQMAERVTHGRGGVTVSLASIGEAVRRLLSDPGWAGDRAFGSGRKRKTTEDEDNAIVQPRTKNP